MQKIIFTLLKFFLFFLAFLVGSFLPLPPPFHFERVLNTTSAGTHIFIGDGLHLMLVLYIVLVVIEVLRKKLRSSVPWTTLALLVAMGLGFLMKLGFKTV
jgi:hypothetical protein